MHGQQNDKKSFSIANKHHHLAIYS
jgi:hypothetical protein